MFQRKWKLVAFIKTKKKKKENDLFDSFFCQNIFHSHFISLISPTFSNITEKEKKKIEKQTNWMNKRRTLGIITKIVSFWIWIVVLMFIDSKQYDGEGGS